MRLFVILLVLVIFPIAVHGSRCGEYVANSGGGWPHNLNAPASFVGPSPDDPRPSTLKGLDLPTRTGTFFDNESVVLLDDDGQLVHHAFGEKPSEVIRVFLQSQRVSGHSSCIAASSTTNEVLVSWGPIIRVVSLVKRGVTREFDLTQELSREGKAPLRITTLALGVGDGRAVLDNGDVYQFNLSTGPLEKGGLAKIFSVPTTDLPYDPNGTLGPAYGSPDGTFVAAMMVGGNIGVFDVNRNTRQSTLRSSGLVTGTGALSPGGRYFAGNAFGSVPGFVLDTGTGEAVAMLSGGMFGSLLAFTGLEAAEPLLATTLDSGQISVRALQQENSFTSRQRGPWIQGNVTALSFSPDGKKLLVTRSKSPSAEVWDVTRLLPAPQSTPAPAE